jgi:hypothetical protein
MDYLDIPEGRLSQGDMYLVDVGKLVPVLATSPKDAYELASLSIFGRSEEIPPTDRVLYRLDEEGEVSEVIA